jgi:hypothetical protein
MTTHAHEPRGGLGGTKLKIVIIKNNQESFRL